MPALAGRAPRLAAAAMAAGRAASHL